MAEQAAIGVICAVPQELAALRAALDHDRREEIGGFGFDRGQLDGHPVVLAEAGIGKVNTATVATILALRFKARILVFKGVAGGLDPALAIGDVVVSDRTVQHDCGVIQNEQLQPYQAGHVPFFNPTRELGYAVEPALLERARARLEGIELAPLSAKAGGGGRAPQDRLRHDFGGRSVHQLRGHARAAASRVRRQSGRDGGGRHGPGRPAGRPAVARGARPVRSGRWRIPLRFRRLRRGGLSCTPQPSCGGSCRCCETWLPRRCME